MRQRETALPARRPFLSVSRPMSSTGGDRTIRLTQNVLVEYTISRGRLLIFIADVFNDTDVLITDDRSRPGGPSSLETTRQRSPSRSLCHLRA